MGRLKSILRHDESGYYAVAAIVGITVVLSILSGSLMYLTNQDVTEVKREGLTAQAMNAAEAGVNAYLWKLNQDHDYYQTTSDTAELDWVAFKDAEYRLKVKVDTGRPGVTLLATGRVLNPMTSPPSYVERRAQVRLAKKSFVQNIYVSDHETIEGTGQKIWFITGDTIRGPIHSNDEININGSPVFEGKVTTAMNLNIQSGNPVFQQGYKTGAAPLELPTSNQELKAWAQQDGYYYYGETTITLLAGGRLNVSNSSALSQDSTGNVAMPANGVIYIDGQSGSKWNATNGDVYIQGIASGRLTVGSKNNVYITGNISYENSEDHMLGLVAENYVYVNHYDRSNNDVAPNNISVTAAIFALNHSFGFERYNQGTAKGTLTVTGAIAQRYRGAVGTFSGGTRITGYAKDYWYDARMQYQDPPHLVEPLNAGFEIIDWQEIKG